jgi:2-dehydropantoate 2-reductase
MPEEILIVGTGALANLFGARLAGSGKQVTLLGTWQAGLSALQAHGVRVQDGETTRKYPVRAASSLEGLSDVRLALVLVKSWQTPRAAKQLARVLSPNGVALTLQNGLGNGEVLAEQLGADRVAQGVTTTGATLLAPGRVRPGGEGTISLGMHPRVGACADLLQGAGFDVEMIQDLQTVQWKKLLVNAAINPLTALLNVPNGRLLEKEQTRRLIALIVLEVQKVAVQKGIPFGFENPVQLVEDVARKTASNISSMLQDRRRGAPTEIDAICGAVVRAGKEVQVPTPINQTLLYLMQSLIALEK